MVNYLSFLVIYLFGIGIRVMLACGMSWEVLPCGLNCVPSKFVCSSPNPPVPQNVTLFGNRVTEDVIGSDEVTLEQGGLI